MRSAVLLKLHWLLVLGLQFWTPIPVGAYNYCGVKELCGTTPHFMCDPSVIKTAEPNTKLLAFVPMTKKMRQVFIDTHNKLRDNLASGAASNGNSSYPKASRMRDLIWDNELAYIAHTHASQCAFQHDPCRNTMRFPHSGQNLGFFASGVTLKIVKVITDTLNLMYDEKNVIADPVALSHSYGPHCKGAGHFTVLAADMVSRVGCAVAYCKECGMEHCYYLTCNYDMTNVGSSQIYEIGEPASKCDTWETVKHTQYPNLCANTGKLFHDSPFL